MGFFDFFNKPKNSNKAVVRESVPIVKDQRKAECPYCHSSLKKIPGSKTKCLHCGKYMFVRTRPSDEVRAVVTKEEAEKIDEDWSIFEGRHDLFLLEKERVISERESLRKKFGEDPSDGDVAWSVLSNSLIEHAQNGDWGLYRNSRFQMAEILRKDMKFEQALQIYLEVCFIDLNGPNNNSGLKDADLKNLFPPFDPNGSDSFLAPGVVSLVNKMMKKLDIDKEKIKSIFINHNSLVEKSLKLPLSAESAWLLLSEQL